MTTHQRVHLANYLATTNALLELKCKYKKQFETYTETLNDESHRLIVFHEERRKNVSCVYVINNLNENISNVRFLMAGRRRQVWKRC